MEAVFHNRDTQPVFPYKANLLVHALQVPFVQSDREGTIFVKSRDYLKENRVACMALHPGKVWT